MTLPKKILHHVALMLLIGLQAGFSQSQVAKDADREIATVKDDKGGDVSAPRNVGIEPRATDAEIARRLVDILRQTEWFVDITVDVRQGVVFLTGLAMRDEHRKWASDLASKTEDVVAVVNRITLVKQPLWNFSGIVSEFSTLGLQTVESIPFVILTVVVTVLSWLISGRVANWSKQVFNQKMGSKLLADVSARAVAMVVFIAGLYLALRVSGLTQIAVTLLGGTGLLGLVIGIAFRDIAENFLASILISVQRPFSLGDLIDVNNSLGYVESVTMQGTMLLMQDGNFVQIPNAVVYKSIIKNLSANPKTRIQFDLPCDAKLDLGRTQDALAKILRKHEAVLRDPEATILIETVGVDMVTFRGYCWIDGEKHSVQKVRSALLRAVLCEVKQSAKRYENSCSNEPAWNEMPSKAVHVVEKDLANDASTLKSQAQNSQLPEQGENLIADEVRTAPASTATRD